MSYSPPIQVWSPLAMPPGLDPTSYQVGDGISGWSLQTDEGGAITEDAFGLTNGTLTGPSAWKVLPAGELSITCSAGFVPVTAMPTAIQTALCGLVIGNLNTTIAATDFYRFSFGYTGVAGPQIRVEIFVNNAFSSSLGSRGARLQGGGFFRVGVDAARTRVNFYYGESGIGWRPIFTSLPAIGITEAGFLASGWTAGLAGSVSVPFFRFRVGAGELTNTAPEGYLVEGQKTR